MTSKHKQMQTVTHTIHDKLCQLESKVKMHKANVEQLENNMKLLEKNLEDFKLEIMSFMEQMKILETKADKFKQGKYGMQSTYSVPQDKTSYSTSQTNNFTAVSIQHDNPSSTVIPSSARPTVTSSKSVMPQSLRDNQEFTELQSCYDDILRNMPNDYMQTVQTLERFLCDVHVSAIFECSSVSDANRTILECLTEHAAYKEHILEFCERLLLITNAPELMCVIENLRESVMINLHGLNLQEQQVSWQPEIKEVEVFNKLKPHQFTPAVVDVLKKYYHCFLANMVPEDVRNNHIHKCTWIAFENINQIPNQHFLDLLILMTESNIHLLRFSFTLEKFIQNSDITRSFLIDLITAYKCNALTNTAPNSVKFDVKNSEQEFFEIYNQVELSSQGVALLRKYYSAFLIKLQPDCLSTLISCHEMKILISNETLNRVMSCSSSLESNKEILHFLIQSNVNNDNQLLGFSFLMQTFTKESDVAVLFRDDCLEMLMEKANYNSSQQDVPEFFPVVNSTINDNIAADDTNNSECQLSNPTSLNINNEIPIESNSKPTLRELYEKITPNYAAHWKRIGVFLNIPKGELDAIEFDFLGNCQECCDRMLAKWLDLSSSATISWKQLKDAVTSAILRPIKRTKQPPPTLPANYAPRPELLKEISTAILKTSITLTSEVTVTIRGIGGIGKSTIAKALCHETSIQEYFTDGFLWISLTPPHNVTDELHVIYNKLTNQPIEGSLSFVKSKIQSHLMSCSYKLLVILDDVWEAEDALVYVEVFSSCKILLTTRKSDINSKVLTKCPIDVKPMEMDEAVKLLTYRIDVFKTLGDKHNAMILKLAEYLHCWPLLLNLVRTQLYIYCTEWKMPPEEAMLAVTQKLSKSVTAFDQASREKAVKVCLDTSLNLLPEQDIIVLRCAVITLGGLGPYALKDTVEKVSKMTSEQFNMSVTNLWSHGLIELTNVPMYPTSRYISCVGTHHIVAHYITETIPPEQLYETFNSFDQFMGMHDLFKVFMEENIEDYLVNELGAILLYFIPHYISYHIRVTSVLACLLEKLPPDSAGHSFKTITNQLTMENMYSNISKDCTLIVSLLIDNKYSDAVEWLKKHFKNHPLLFASGHVLHNEKLVSFEEFTDDVCNVLVYMTTMHKCFTVLKKGKASDEDIFHLMDYSGQQNPTKFSYVIDNVPDFNVSLIAS